MQIGKSQVLLGEPRTDARTVGDSQPTR
jgi:hypothetical protein